MLGVTLPWTSILSGASSSLMCLLAHMQTLIHFCVAVCLAQNVSHENDLIFMGMKVQETFCIRIVSYKGSFCHTGKSQLSIHEQAQRTFDLVV